MAEQEQCVRVTRSMKRRAAVAGAEDQSAPKKRVVLGELPNLSNVVVPVNQNAGVEPLKPKCVSKAKAKAKNKGLTTTAVKTTKEIDTGLGGDGKSDDPQLCRAYASDIYEYLRKTEVRGFFFFFSLIFVLEMGAEIKVLGDLNLVLTVERAWCFRWSQREGRYLTT